MIKSELKKKINFYSIDLNTVKFCFKLDGIV